MSWLPWAMLLIAALAIGAIVAARQVSGAGSERVASASAPYSQVVVAAHPVLGQDTGQVTSSLVSASDNHSLPDRGLTPGAIDPAVTQSNIARTICVSGYTRSVRPSEGYTFNLKREQLDDPRLGYEDRDTHDYEEDHLVPLELGGSPDDRRNLWPEHWAEPNGARTKDRLENELHRRVCLDRGDPLRISLTQAQQAIATNWLAAYQSYVSE
jgi:hypothetical protein